LAKAYNPSGPTDAIVTPGPNGQLTFASIPTFLALRTLRLKKFSQQFTTLLRLDPSPDLTFVIQPVELQKI
jgi:hypothetical protein